MELEVVGRHALLFDDDATSSFVNSPQALVPWNDDTSLLIDRYDVRHLLQRIPSRASSSRILQEDSGDGYSRSDLDRERYNDLPPVDDDGEEVAPVETQKGSSGGTHGTFQAIPFSYGNVDGSFGRKHSDVDLDASGYHPPFPLPESLLNHLPPTEKLHQIIARTALFVSVHGGQSEIVLRVKQGNNPTFGFLMPDHHLHCYFRFLVAHPEIISDAKKSEVVQEQKNIAGSGENENQPTQGVLSMIESIYGSGDDDNESDAVGNNSTASAPVTVTQPPVNTIDLAPISSVETNSGVNSLNIAKDSKLSLRKSCSIVLISAGASQSKTRSGSSVDDISFKRHNGDMAQAQNLIVEPSASLKETINKVVEFIFRNGKEFEEVLIKQDTAHGRFPFLLPNNLYHPYYLKVLQEASESKTKVKSQSNQGKQDSSRKTRSLRNSQEREESVYLNDLVERKEKFKATDSSKKDTHKLPDEPIKQSGVTAEVAASIVMAATRGLSSPSVLSAKQPVYEENMVALLNFTERSLDSSKRDVHFKLHGDLHTKSQRSNTNDCNLTSAPASNGSIGTVSVFSSANQMAGDTASINNVKAANVIAKHAAHIAASETDSSEASLTREQKLKAERLKRAKMFTALIKSGENVREKMSPIVPSRSGDELTASDSGFTGSASDLTEIDRELMPPNEGKVLNTMRKLGDTSDSTRSESRKHTSALEDLADVRKMEQAGSSSLLDQDDISKKKKRHSSSHSKHHSSNDEDRNEKRSKSYHHHSSKDEEEYHHSSKGEDRHEKRSKSHHHHISKDDKYHHSPKDEDQYLKRSKSHHHRSYRHRSSYDDDDEHHISHRHKTKYLKRDLEQQDDVRSSISVSSKDISSHVTSSPKGGCQSRSESATERGDSTAVPDDLRAKVRAMLMATL